MTLANRLRNIAVPFVFGVAFLAFWEGAVKFFKLKPYFLAPPSKILSQFFTNASRIWDAASVS
jgi:NitT/TauT family transport system permease protein